MPETNDLIALTVDVVSAYVGQTSMCVKTCRLSSRQPMLHFRHLVLLRASLRSPLMLRLRRTNLR